MMMSVLERTNEIGVLQALGMKNYRCPTLYSRVHDHLLNRGRQGPSLALLSQMPCKVQRSNGRHVCKPSDMPINTTLYPHWA